MAEQTKILSYRILLRKEPEGGYTVTVPTLPGCITFGSDIPEAIAGDDVLERYGKRLDFKIFYNE